MTTQHPWFDVDKEGLARLLDRRGRHRVIAELPSNAFDENITYCSISLKRDSRSRYLTVFVEDDSPDGFRQLSDAWTLFAPSYKTGIADKRGRFNLGEKLFLSMCQRAEIATTSGTVIFDETVGRTEKNIKREVGTRLTAKVRMTLQDELLALELLRSIIPPGDVNFYVNDELMTPRVPLTRIRVTLPTEIEGPEGWKATSRSTEVEIYEPRGNETPQVYEMGIPVVEYDGRWHVNVMQKVPLNSDRDNVTPAYLRKLHTAVLDNTFALIEENDTTSTWVKEAMPNASIEAISEVVKKRFGDKAVAFDPSYMQANKEAVARGYTVIPARTFDKETWSRIRDHAVVEPAGRVTPSNSKVKHSADGQESIPREKWTPAMEHLADYSRQVAFELLAVKITVKFYSLITVRHGAWYGPGELSFNLGVLGKSFAEEPDQRKVDALLIHELAHHRVEDHLSHDYYHELCRLGAIFRDVQVRL